MAAASMDFTGTRGILYISGIVCARKPILAERIFHYRPLGRPEFGRVIGELVVRIRAVALACSPLALFLASPAAAQAQDPAYRINPGDELTISVWGEERLGRDVSVLPDGTIAYPLVGQVHAAGMLPTEIESRITAGLKPQYRGPVPQVTVSVKRASGFQFSVIGKVKAPGTFTP